LEEKVTSLKEEVSCLKDAIKELECCVPDSESETEEEEVEEQESMCPSVKESGNHSDSEYYTWTSTGTDTEDESGHKDDDWGPAGESNEEEDTTEDEAEMSEDQNYIKVDPNSPNYNQPKVIVFYEMLLKIFLLFCFNCKAENPKVSMRQNGTMVTVTQECSKCKGYVWNLQPYLPHGKFPSGNMMLSLAVLMAGASISKILLVFRHMGLCCYTARTFFSHQRSFLFPTVISHWELYRTGLVSKLKSMKDVVWSGDGRFDSMGHAAKYGVYTMFCTTIMKVVQFEIVQANETGGSQQTELEGAKRCFNYLQQLGLTISVFISDRHRGIAKWIRETCRQTTHYYDIWHVARSVTKKLLSASKEKGCEVIKEWTKGIRRHLYWSATSTKPGFGSLILAKWNSFMRHVANKHTDHPDPLYKRCHHEVLQPRKWIKIGTAAYDKLKSLLTSKLLLGDIKKLSPDAQTSCLEGFHATLNHWHPKMIGFSWLGSFCRHILASLHFNENVHRDTQLWKEGEKYFKVTYPKFKLGEEVVREVAAPPTYSYVEDIKKLLFTLTKAEMLEVFNRYSSKAPAPLSANLRIALISNQQ